MKHVVLVDPTYGPLMPESHVSILVAVMYAATHGVVWEGVASTDRESWSAARSLPVDALRRYAGDVSIDGIVWADSDMTFPKEAFARLVSYDLDLVSGVYFQRKPPYWPNVYQYDEKKKGFRRFLNYPENTLAPVGGFGFGICYTSRKLLETMPESPFTFGEFSEDLGFCRMAVERGFTPYVDTAIECEHYLGPRWSNKKLFQKYRDALGVPKCQVT